MQLNLLFFALLLSTIYSSLCAYEFGIVTMFRNEAPFLREWVEYHKMIGVDHFWMYNDRSTDNYLEVLQPYIDEGLVEIIDWPMPEGTPTFIIHQILAFKDSFSRTSGKAKWVALIDIDEFILPLKDKTVTACLENHFKDAVAIYVNWRNFGTGGISVPLNEPILYYLTASSLKSHSNNAVGKTFVRPEYVKAQDVWYPHHFPLIDSFHYVNGIGNPLYHKDSILPTDGKHYDKFIRINHYALRDENYFQRRLERAKSGEYGDLKLLMEWYKSYSLCQDLKITDFIKKHYPEKYKEIWEKTNKN